MNKHFKKITQKKLKNKKLYKQTEQLEFIFEAF